MPDDIPSMQFETEFVEVVKRTPDVKSFRFEKPDGFIHVPGQYMYVFIKVDGGVRKHHFTISSSPTEDYLEFTKAITGSEFSRTLDSIKGGEWALIDAPYGKFVYAGEDKIAALTGGIGVTPIRCIARDIIDRKKGTDMSILYANHTEEDIIFRSEFDSMMDEYPSFRIKHVLTRQEDWQGLKGHIDARMVKEQIPDYMDRVFFICGPPGMVDAMVEQMNALGMPGDKVRIEHFPGY